MMHGPEKSDPAIVAVKPTNKATRHRLTSAALHSRCRRWVINCLANRRLARQLHPR